MGQDLRTSGVRRLRHAALGAVLVAATAAAASTINWLPTPIVEWVLRQDIVLRTESWTQRLLAQLHRGGATFTAGEVTGVDVPFLLQVTRMTEIYDLRFVDRDGRIFWSTRASDIGTRPDPARFADAAVEGRLTYERFEIAAATIEPLGTRAPNTSVGVERRDVAQISRPVLHDGRVVGAIDFFVDLSAERAVFVARTRTACLVASGLATGFAVVVTAVVLRLASRRESELRERTEAEHRILQDQVRLAREVRLLGELNGWLQSSRSLDELFQMVGRFMSHLLPSAEGSLYVYSNSRDVLDGATSWNGGHHHVQMRPESCWGLRRGRTYAYGASEIEFACAHVEPHDDRPYLCLPILAYGETVGLIHLKARPGISATAFSDTGRLARVCAEQISLAIANVRLRDQLHDQSIRDPLTGLHNRRHLTDALRTDLDHASRRSAALSLLSIDIDHFKKFNDNHGHDAGDMVLRAVATALEQGCDGDEVACRLGGEEFMVLLPNADLPAAAARAEALRVAVERVTVRYGEKTLPRITISTGIAAFPDNGALPQQLMMAADEALYRAKAAGRNQVVTAEEVQRDPAPGHAVAISVDMLPLASAP